MAVVGSIHSDLILVNDSEGDPALYVDYPDRDNALLFDAGDVAGLGTSKLADLDAVFLTHHHADHVSDLDRVIRANLNSDKTIELFGPEGTIERVYDRVRSYAHSYFPFQRLVLNVHDVRDDRIDTAALEYSKRFPPPERTVSDYSPGQTLFENESVRVTSAPTDHTVAGLAYALVEKPSYAIRQEKLAQSDLKRGPWIARLIERLEANESAAPVRRFEIEGGTFDVKTLADRFLRRSRGQKIVYLVDTIYQSGTPRGEGLCRLAKSADRLFGDCFYRDAQSKAAAKHRHLTTSDLARLATDAGVKSVTPIHFSQRYLGRGDQTVEELRGHLRGSNVRLIPA